MVGDVQVLLILEQAFLGKHRFDEFVAETGIARSVVSNRLQKLVEADVLVKLAGNRAGYQLTEKGRDLFQVALMILRWQHRWESGVRGFSVELIHRTCGQKATPLASCRHCHADIDARDVTWAPGPGLSQVVPVYSRRRMPTAVGGARGANRAIVDSVIELFGNRWATLVIRACFTGINRFDDIQRDTLMASNILSDRIDRLQRQGIIKARPYSPFQDRYEYRLTDKGRDLYPVLLALMHWGDRWYADSKGPPLLLTHNSCGESLRLMARCSACGGALTSTNMVFQR